MLVDVVRLRNRGQRRTRDEVIATAPVRGDLQLSCSRPGRYAGQKNAPLLAGLVVVGGTTWAIEPLDQAQVRKIRGNSMIVLGIEQIEHARSLYDYPQVWWCRLIPDRA